MLGRIEASDRRLRRFVADASHELRTPLAAVRAYAELFGRGAESRPEDLARSMSGITRETERMSVLVEDLLLLARLDEGRPLDRERVQLDALVRDAVDMARDSRSGPASRPRRRAGRGARRSRPPPADRRQPPLERPLAHAGPRSGARARAPRERTRRRRGRGQRLGARATTTLDRVFERFYRADVSRSRASGGVGLGLSIVAAVARAHGGTVSARAGEGGGAIFRIELPAAD